MYGYEYCFKVQSIFGVIPLLLNIFCEKKTSMFSVTLRVELPTLIGSAITPRAELYLLR